MENRKPIEGGRVRVRKKKKHYPNTKQLFTHIHKHIILIWKIIRRRRRRRKKKQRTDDKRSQTNKVRQEWPSSKTTHYSRTQIIWFGALEFSPQTFSISFWTHLYEFDGDRIAINSNANHCDFVYLSIEPSCRIKCADSVAQCKIWAQLTEWDTISFRCLAYSSCCNRVYFVKQTRSCCNSFIQNKKPTATNLLHYTKMFSNKVHSSTVATAPQFSYIAHVLRV